MSRQWISFPLREGEHSRQAHCDFPEGTYEREMGREGFFGPVTQLHHKHPPTGWVDWEGPLRPHAFNFNRIASERDCHCCSVNSTQLEASIKKMPSISRAKSASRTSALIS